MKLRNKLLLLAMTLVMLTGRSVAQDWVQKMRDPNVNFFEVQKAFNKYYVKKDRQLERERRKAQRKAGEGVHEEELEVPGYNQYKRWEWFMAPRVSVTGERFDPSMTWKESEKYQKMYSSPGAGNWSLIGPVSSIPSSGGGAGRVNFVRFHPTNANTIYVGTPAGGLWKSTNNGATWSTNTDKLPQVIGCTDLAFDPANPDIMYLATGDGDAGDTYTVGLLKSTDAGATWNPTGLSFYTANFRQISKVLINPNNGNEILVCTSAGVYRSADAGVTFTQTQPGTFKDMEFKPGDPNTVYVAGTEFYRSTDNGQTWTKITTNLPLAANLSRIAIAVTPANPAIVYLLSAKVAPDYGFEGIYKSTNSGAAFTKVTVSTPSNILGWVSGGTDTGGQGWYTLSLAASPTDANEIIAGGVNIWQSIDGGQSFALNAHWTGSGAPYVHADVHDLIYKDGSTIYAGCDGGLFSTTNSGGSWDDLSNGLQIAQMYGFGQSQQANYKLLQGWQDNGTNLYNGTNWTKVIGGDGMLAFIDRTNDNNMWGELPNGSLQRSTNGGATWSSAMGSIGETGAWSTPWSQDPVTAGTIYAGFSNMFKSTNGGVSWTKISNWGTTSTTITQFAVSPANNQVIWVAKGTTLYRTTNGGTSWTTISNIPSANISYIACHATDANKAWITFSGFSSAYKVYETSNQGTSWQSLSGSMPNIPVNCITFVPGSNDGLYVGTDLGVFYKDASMTVWQPFSNGLPNVPVTQIGIHTPTGKIRVSTYGRGMWESDPYVPGAYAPTAAFSGDNRIACPGNVVHYQDYSAGQPTGWSWSFPGGNPSTSTQQNPVVYYNTPGVYPVTLTVTNGVGSDNTTYSNYISISNSSVSDPVGVGANRCGAGPVTLSATGSGLGTLRWWDAPGGGTLLNTGSTYSTNITTTTTFYVDEELPAGNMDLVGEFAENFSGGAYFTANDIRGLYFDVLAPVVLNTVDVYSNSAGNRTIEILDEQGNLVIDKTVALPASPTTPTTVTLNFTLYPGVNYFIKCRGTVDLWRKQTGAVYPYTSSALNITGSNAGSPGYYYFFYNWQYTTVDCNTGRTAVVAADTCATGVNEFEVSSHAEVFPNPSNGNFNVKFTAAVADNYTVRITNEIGQSVYEDKVENFIGNYDKKVELSDKKANAYLLTITNSANKQVVRRVIVQ